MKVKRPFVMFWGRLLHGHESVGPDSPHITRSVSWVQELNQKYYLKYRSISDIQFSYIDRRCDHAG